MDAPNYTLATYRMYTLLLLLYVLLSHDYIAPHALYIITLV